MVKVDSRQYKQLIKVLEALPKDAMDNTYPKYRKDTPIRTGNARKNTKRRAPNKIASNYPYAGRLDDGWSKQSPKGFTEPAIENIEEFVEKTIKRL